MIEPGVAFFLPKGVANSYQALNDGTTYVYLVDGVWKPGLTYEAIDLFDESLAVQWPIGQELVSVSPKDSANPPFTPQEASIPRPWIIFGDGQVAKAVRQLDVDSRLVTRSNFDFATASVQQLVDSIPPNSVVINAAAYTRVDDCESPSGFTKAMDVNFHFVENLAAACREQSATLVHFSSDYVFDGENIGEYTEEDRPNPRSRYGITKMLGDQAARKCPHHYIIRTSWVFGEGPNFISTVLRLARSGQPLKVVSDQIGRPTSSSELARFASHLVDGGHDFGTYNLSLDGRPLTWFELAQTALELAKLDQSLLQPVTTEEYSDGKGLAPRPPNGMLNLKKAAGVGFEPSDYLGEVSRWLEIEAKYH
jgi:dTDP-4-dehydrorhamnose 3,5-epimerase